MEEPIYRCAQDEFYLAAYLMLNSLEDDLDYFVLHKPKYDLAFVTALRQEVEAAELLPDNEQRTEPVKRMRNALIEKTDGPCTLKLAALRTYIKGAYTNPLDADSALQEAGFNKLNQALNYDWNALHTILTKADQFISENTPLLIANNNMPPAFPAAFQTLKTEVTTDIDAYLNRKENTKQGTRDKNVTNNGLYRKLMTIADDGQVVWLNDPTRAQQYIWDRILEIITPPGAAGLRGTVKTQTDFLPVAGAQITMQKAGNPPVIFTTSATGRYDSDNLPAGIYTIKINAPGLAEIESEVEIKLGVISYKHWLMEPGGGIIAEGNLAINQIGNVTIPASVNDDTTVNLEAFGTQMMFMASNTPNGDIMGSGAIYVNPGMPQSMKWNQLVAQIGRTAANPFLNVKNTGTSAGAWKVSFIAP